jgi:hypothetical protein
MRKYHRLLGIELRVESFNRINNGASSFQFVIDGWRKRTPRETDVIRHSANCPARNRVETTVGGQEENL